jgi:hypothetical protein
MDCSPRDNPSINRRKYVGFLPCGEPILQISNLPRSASHHARDSARLSDNIAERVWYKLRRMLFRASE